MTLKLIYVRSIEFFEGDILSEHVDAEGNIYIEKWVDLDTTLVVKTRRELIDQYEAGALPLLDLLIKSDNDSGHLAHYVAWDMNEHSLPPPNLSIIYRPCQVSTLNASYLPDPTCVHDPELKPCV